MPSLYPWEFSQGSKCWYFHYYHAINVKWIIKKYDWKTVWYLNTPLIPPILPPPQKKIKLINQLYIWWSYCVKYRTFSCSVKSVALVEVFYSVSKQYFAHAHQWPSFGWSTVHSVLLVQYMYIKTIKQSTFVPHFTFLSSSSFTVESLSSLNSALLK